MQQHVGDVVPSRVVAPETPFEPETGARERKIVERLCREP